MEHYGERKKLNVEEIEARVKDEPKLELEKGDLKAIVIAAFITLGPFLLFLIGVPFLVFWLFFGRF